MAKRKEKRKTPPVTLPDLPAHWRAADIPKNIYHLPGVGRVRGARADLVEGSVSVGLDEAPVRVLRARGSRALELLPRALRAVACSYAAAWEAVEAGGVSGGAEIGGGTSAPGGACEGRQSLALVDVERLRAFDAAIGPAVTIIAARAQGGNPASVLRLPDVDLVRAVAVDGKTCQGVLEAHGFYVNKHRVAKLTAALNSALSRMESCDT